MAGQMQLILTVPPCALFEEFGSVSPAVIELVSQGVLALKQFHIDQLPPTIKLQAARTIGRAITAADEAADEIDTILQNYARSPLVDSELDDTSKDRAANLADWKMLYPGSWRAPRGKPKQK